MKLISTQFIALVVSGMILCLMGGYFFQGLSSGRNVSYDGFYSMERSIGFEKYHDWFSVYSGNKRSAKKPPLQYWMNAICLKAGVPVLLALRLASFSFLLGSIIVTGILCRHFSGGNPWALPSGLLLAGCSQQLLLSGRSAMLDSGLCFFTLCTLMAFFFAEKKPKWWILFGVSVGLGALQKAPVGFVYAVILLVILHFMKDKYYNWQNLNGVKEFRQGGYIAVAMMLFWPVLQSFRFGGNYLNIAVLGEMLMRLSPVAGDTMVNTAWFRWFPWLWDDIYFVAILGVLGLGAVFFCKRLRCNNLMFSFCLLAVCVGVTFSFATGKIYPRYLVVFSPLLIIITVQGVSELIPWRPACLVVAFVLVIVNVGRVSATMEKIYLRDTFSRAEGLVSLLDSHCSSEDQVFIDRGFLPPGAYGFFGKTTKPYFSNWLRNEKGRLRTIRQLKKATGKVIGITSPDKEEFFKGLFSNYKRVYVDDETLIWIIYRISSKS